MAYSLSHFTSIFLGALAKQSDTFVLDKCENNVDKKLYSEPHVDLHKLKNQKVLGCATALP